MITNHLQGPNKTKNETEATQFHLKQSYVLKCCSVTQSFPILCDPMDYSKPGLPVPHHLLKFAQVHVHCFSDAIQPSHPRTHFSFCPQSFPASGTFPMSWLFTSDDRKYWSFSFSASPSNEYSGLISLKVVWFDHLAVQGTFRILLQYHIFFFPVPHFEGINTHIYIY